MAVALLGTAIKTERHIFDFGGFLVERAIFYYYFFLDPALPSPFLVET
jgi:hypothetical protein